MKSNKKRKSFTEYAIKRPKYRAGGTTALKGSHYYCRKILFKKNNITKLHNGAEVDA